MKLRSDRRPSLFALLAITILPLAASAPAANTIPGRAPHSANPILPGYYADPSVVQDGGKSYLYATIDPWGDKTLGCWESSDFKNWTYRELNWPTKQACTSATSKGAGVWAPSVIKGPDGKFHMVISVGSEVWVGVADHPLGPWRNALGGQQPLIPYHYKPGFHMIDAEYFLDDDGQAYLYWGSGHGWVNGKCWLVKLKPDLSTFDSEVKDVTPANYFEGPLMVKRHGLYFLMYSSGKTIEENYQVHYAVGKSPAGPFAEGPDSPVLVTDRNLNIISPGHHTIFQRDGSDFILYHRHSIPFDPKFIGRQICVDPITFTADGRIEQIKPTHQGPPLVQGRAEAQTRLTAGAVFTASSEAGEFTRAACAFDANYASRWAAAPAAQGAWLQVDLGGISTITRQLIRPEYAWKYHRFAVEASSDGKTWQTVEDHTRAAVTGSPLVIGKEFTARFVRLVFPDSLKGSDISLIEWSLF